MSANRDIGTSGFEAAIFELWLPVPFDGFGMGLLEILDQCYNGCDRRILELPLLGRRHIG